jgi:hypothetical protein
VLVLTLSGVYVAMRLYPSFSFASASEPIKNSLSPVTAVALSVPVGFMCYQLYYWGYSPLRLLGFVSANRGWEILECLSASQKTLVCVAMADFVKTADRPLSQEQRTLLVSNGYGEALDDPLKQPKARLNQRMLLFRRLRWLELEPPPGGWKDPALKKAVEDLYHHRWWAHRHIASILLDISTMGNGTADVKAQWTGASDIYHALGSTRTAVVFGTVGGIAADMTKLTFRGHSSSWVAVLIGAALMVVLAIMLIAVLNTVRARANRSSCNRLGFGLRTTFAEHPELLGKLRDDADSCEGHMV